MQQVACFLSTTFHHYPIFLLFYLFHFPLSACPSAWRAQSVPSFSSVSSSSSSSAPLTSFPPIPPPPAPRQPKARLTSVGEPGSALTRPTSLPSAPETGTGTGGDDLACQWLVHTFQFMHLLLCRYFCFSLCPSMFFSFSPLSQLPGRVNGGLPNLRPL